MDNLQAFKEKNINDYISSIDILETDINTIQKALKRVLGEEPAVEPKYITNEMLTEGGEVSKVVESLESITIYFTVDKEITPGNSVPFMVSKTFYTD